MIPTTIYCNRASSPPLPNETSSNCSMDYLAHDHRRSDSGSLQEEVSSEDLEQLKNMVKDIRQNPDLLSQVFPTFPSNMLDMRRSYNYACCSERQEVKEKWFISIDAIRSS
eukprot:scaffold433_cov161-Skeletonema_marinoi.AAC.8